MSLNLPLSLNLSQSWLSRNLNLNPSLWTNTSNASKSSMRRCVWSPVRNPGMMNGGMARVVLGGSIVWLGPQLRVHRYADLSNSLCESTSAFFVLRIRESRATLPARGSLGTMEGGKGRQGQENSSPKSHGACDGVRLILRGTAQRDATHAEMHEVDSYLRQRMKEAREAENRRMLHDDREYTMKHRPAYSGLPVKPSMLQLEEEELTKYALVDPLDIMEENAQDRLKAQEAPKDMEFMKAEVRVCVVSCRVLCTAAFRGGGWILQTAPGLSDLQHRALVGVMCLLWQLR